MKTPTIVLLLLCLVLEATALRVRPSPAQEAQRKANLARVTKGPKSPIAIPSTCSHQGVVKSILSNLSVERQWSWLVQLTQFPERYWRSKNGVAAAEWIVSSVNSLKPAPGAKLSVKLYKHSDWIQPSVIARYEPTAQTSKEGIVITGSHFDTIGYGGPGPEPHKNPAADDCASGSSVVFEALRLLVETGFIPGRPIEFHWYAAEEEGIYGSNEIAEAYANAGTKVVSYLNLDQSGYVKAGTKPRMGLMMDYTTKPSTDLLRSVIKTYTTLSYVETRCGYECTDNSAWYDHGYEAALAFESLAVDATPYNDQVNDDGSPLDTLDTINATHVAEFSKSTIGFIVELSLA